MLPTHGKSNLRGHYRVHLKALDQTWRVERSMLLTDMMSDAGVYIDDAVYCLQKTYPWVGAGLIMA